MTNPADRSRATRPLTDSPWFWFALFCAVALAVIALVRPKYAQRQQIIEHKYQAERMRGRAADTSRADEALGDRTQPELLIPLEPLAVAIALLLAVCVAMLALQRLRGETPPHGETPP